MGRDVRRKAVKRALDERVISDSRGAGAEPREPGRALGVIAKQPVDIGADHAPVGRYSAFGRTIGKAGERAGTIPAGGHAPMPFLAWKRDAARVAAHRVAP